MKEREELNKSPCLGNCTGSVSLINSLLVLHSGGLFHQQEPLCPWRTHFLRTPCGKCCFSESLSVQPPVSLRVPASWLTFPSSLFYADWWVLFFWLLKYIFFPNFLVNSFTVRFLRLRIYLLFP